MMPCCIGIYPGLFAYLDTARDKASRLRAGVMSVFFATGILAVVAALGLGVLLLQIGLATISNDSLFIVDLIGFPILALIGASYLLGINFMIPIPSAGLPGSLSNMRGLRAAPLYGAFFGGPGAAHCTFMLVIPIVFLSLSALNPVVIFLNFLFFALGRVIPIVVVGTMLQDAQIRFIRALSVRSGALNRLIGIVMILSGISLFFI